MVYRDRFSHPSHPQNIKYSKDWWIFFLHTCLSHSPHTFRQQKQRVNSLTGGCCWGGNKSCCWLLGRVHYWLWIKICSWIARQAALIINELVIVLNTMVDERLSTAGSGGNVAVTTTAHAHISTADQKGHFFKRWVDRLYRAPCGSISFYNELEAFRSSFIFLLLLCRSTRYFWPCNYYSKHVAISSHYKQQRGIKIYQFPL